MSTFDKQNLFFRDTKNHYEILDGLRGVAAIIVVIFHILETFSGGNHITQRINHGYLAVDFFFVLSGFVIGYAYDDRWNKMTLKDFFKRRLIRLHPMIIMGMLIGAIGFYFAASPSVFPMISDTSFLYMLLIMVIGFTLLPVPPSMDIRGWGEMHPLNSPAWTLFFEYIANILYGLFLRKFSNKMLAVFVFLTGCATVYLAVNHGDVVGGWSLEAYHFKTGLIRLLYPFFAGLLLSRIVKPVNIKNAFTWCSVMIVVVLACPRIGGHEYLWMNGVFESISIIIIFPFIVYLGASGEVKGKYALKLCKFLGSISYPVYIIHYPLIYIYVAWVIDKKVSMLQAWTGGLLVLILSITIAYACLKLYDIPVRKWLTKKYAK